MPSCLILNYHQVYSSNGFGDSKYAIGVDEFEIQMRALQYSQRKNILPQDLSSFSEDAFMLTFDDGYSSDFELVAPVLSKYNLKGVFFISIESEAFQKNHSFYKSLSAEGHIIAAHGVNHSSLRPKMKNELMDEFEQCQSSFQNRFGINVEDFALPYGQFNSETLTAAYSRGLKRVYGTSFGLFNPSDSGVIIPRWTITSNISESDFKKVLNSNKLLTRKMILSSRIKKVVTNRFNSEDIFKLQTISRICS